MSGADTVERVLHSVSCGRGCRLLSVEDAARRVGLPPVRIRTLIMAGAVRGYKIGCKPWALWWHEIGLDARKDPVRFDRYPDPEIDPCRFHSVVCHHGRRLVSMEEAADLATLSPARLRKLVPGRIRAHRFGAVDSTGRSLWLIWEDELVADLARWRGGLAFSPRGGRPRVDGAHA
jgi:hypothetical protein